MCVCIRACVRARAPVNMIYCIIMFTHIHIMIGLKKTSVEIGWRRKLVRKLGRSATDSFDFQLKMITLYIDSG